MMRQVLLVVGGLMVGSWIVLWGLCRAAAVSDAGTCPVPVDGWDAAFVRELADVAL